MHISNEHIARLQQVGLGKESVSGTSVAATLWLPKVSGAAYPKATYAYDDGSIGVIDQFKNGQNVKNASEIQLSGDAHDLDMGYLLMAALGTAYPCVAFPIPGSITGTFVEGETITETTSTATGTLRRADVGGTSKVLYVDTTGGTGTFVGAKLLTGGTSGATATGGTIESPAAVRTHLFRRNNTNNPVTYSIHAYDPVSSDKYVFGALDTLSFEVFSGKFATYATKWMAKKLANESTPSPSYTAQNPLMAKYATFSTASAFTGLDAASAVAIERIKFDISKNVTDYQAVGSTDVTGFYNQQYSVKGDMTLLFNVTTQRDYVVNSTKQAMRLKIANTDVTIGSAAHPTLQLDLASVAFEDFSRDTNNNNLVKQTVKFTAEFDITTSATMQALLTNTQATTF